MKRFLAILLALTLALSLALPALAVEPAEGDESTASVPFDEDDSYLSEFDRGWDDGYKAAYDTGYAQGKADYDSGAPRNDPADPVVWDGETYQEGYDNGYIAGISGGYISGYLAQYDKGMEDGYDPAYESGYEAGVSDATAGTPVDPSGLMGPMGEDDDYSYECGLNDGKILGFQDGYSDGYYETAGRYYDDDIKIAEMGGIPGQVNVMFEGAMIQFPDQKPEIVSDRTMVPVRAVMESMGAKVDYDQAGKSVSITLNGAVVSFPIGSDSYTVTKEGRTTTEKMDCACYLKGDRTMVPVRFLSEASGFTVLWDSDTRTVVLVDAKGLITEIDAKFTIINDILAAQLSANQGKKLQTTTSFKLNATLYDDAGKPVSLPLSGKMITATDGTAWRMDLSLDVRSALLALVRSDLDLADTMTLDLRTALTADLSNLTATLLLDGSGKLYIHAPILLSLLADTRQGDNEWMELLDLNQFGVDMSQITNGSLTVGSVLMSALLQDETALEFQEALDISVPLLEQIYGDSVAKQNGSSYTWTLDLAGLLAASGLDQESLDAIAQTADLTATITMDKTGKYDISLDLALNLPSMEDEASTALPGSLRSAGTRKEGSLTFALEAKDLFSLDLTASDTTQEVSRLPELTLPAGAVVTE